MFNRFIVLGIMFLLPTCATVEQPGAPARFKKLNRNSGARIIQKTRSIPVENVRSRATSQFCITDMPYALQKPDRAVNYAPDLHERVQSTIYFGLNSSAITPGESTNLKKLIPILKQANTGFSVIGYTCWVGSKSYNQSLAFKRAKAVAAVLRRAGIRIVSIIGKGKCCYVNHKNPHMDRRVEIRPEGR